MQEIHADLHRLEQQETLCVEANFVERVQALDRLALRVLERIENVQYVHGYRKELASLYRRAERLWQRLDAVNAQLFRRLREQLVAGLPTGPLLRQMCETYVGAPDPTAFDLLTQVTFLNVDARQADYTDGTVFFMYTPFTGRLLQAVLARLHGEARRRPITLATYGACTREAARQSWLQPTVCEAFAHDTLTLFTSL